MNDQDLIEQGLQALRLAAERDDWNACREATEALLLRLPPGHAVRLTRDFLVRRLPGFERQHPGAHWPRELLEAVTEEGSISRGRQWPFGDELSGPGGAGFGNALECLWMASRHRQQARHCAAELVDALSGAIMAEGSEHWGSRQPRAWALWYQLAWSGEDSWRMTDIQVSLRTDADVQRLSREGWLEVASRLESALHEGCVPLPPEGFRVNIERIPLHAMDVLDRCCEDSPSPEHQALFRVARGAMEFILYSGQLYRFEEFLSGRAPDGPRASYSSHAAELLERTPVAASSSERQEGLSAALSALEFVEDSGQRQGLEEYLHRLEVDTLPPVIAAFSTMQEADAWLDSQAVPPYSARVLIGDAYHTVARDREFTPPNFNSIQLVESFIERHSRDALPPVVASFQTRAEAEAWWASHPAPPTHAFLQVGGEHHLAVYQESVQHRALYPFSQSEGSAGA